MDTDPPNGAPHGLGMEHASRSGELAGQVAELSAQLQAKALETEDARRRAADAEVRAHQAAELAGHAQVLADDAQARATHAESRLAQSEGRLGELGDRVALARHTERELRKELQDSMLERAELRRRLAALELNLTTALSGAGHAASERARAQRLLAERDAARLHAETERRRADASTSRATRAEARLFVLRSPMLTADRRLSALTESLLRGHGDLDPGASTERIVDLRDDPAEPDPAPTEGGTGSDW